MGQGFRFPKLNKDTLCYLVDDPDDKDYSALGSIWVPLV